MNRRRNQNKRSWQSQHATHQLISNAEPFSCDLAQEEAEFERPVELIKATIRPYNGCCLAVLCRNAAEDYVTCRSTLEIVCREVDPTHRLELTAYAHLIV